MANPFDQFDAPPSPPPAASGGNPFDQFDMPQTIPGVGAPRQAPTVAEDVAGSLQGGIIRGAVSLPGMPADVLGLMRAGVDAGVRHTIGRVYNRYGPGGTGDWSADERAAPDTLASHLRVEDVLPKGEDFVKATEAVIGETYRPQTTAGKYAATVGEFIPGSGGRVLSLGVLPALASEFAGQQTAGTKYEPYVRAGAAMLTGGVAGAVTGPNHAAGVARKAMEGVTPEQLDAAEAMFHEAAAQGIKLDRFVALDAVTNGATSLSDVLRVVEGMGGMRRFYSDQAQGVDRASRGQFDRIAAPSDAPSAVGLDVQQAAREAIPLTPEGQALDQAQWLAGPRTTAEQAGQVIQPGLADVEARREGMRAALADKDYGDARAAPANVPVEGRIVPPQDLRTEIPFDMGPPVPGSAAFEPAPPPVQISSAPQGPAPQSLARYIAKNGGLALERGEAAAQGLDRFNIPFAGRVARPTGRGIDAYWREKLIEEGYLPPDADGGAARDVTNELFELLREEQAGRKVYRAQDQDEVARRQNRGGAPDDDASFNADRDRTREDVVGELEAAGHDLRDYDPKTLDRAIDLVHRGDEVDPLVAYERAANEGPPATSGQAAPAPDQRGPTSYVQVDARPVVTAIDSQLETAKGGVRQALTAARKALMDADGNVDGSVKGLQSSREAITQLISTAKREGHNNTVRELEGALKSLDTALEQVPAFAEANRGFAAASEPLRPFDRDRVPGRITERDQYNRGYTMPPDQAPKAIEAAGPSGARDFNEVAPGPAREAHENYLTTSILDGATDGQGRVDADKLRLALRDNQDTLNQFPGVRDRVSAVIAARDGLARVEVSPLGKLAQKPEVGAAIKVLFPSVPLAGSSGEISRAVGAVAARNPRAASELVRIHTETIFNEATSRLQSGPNAMGGAGFVQALRGNPQQAANFEAAIRALPNGEAIWPGLNRYLDILEATGRRQNVGSRTSFNNQMIDQLKTGTAIGEAASIAATGGIKLPARIMDAMQNWRMGQGVEQLARLATDPSAGSAFRALATAPQGGAKAIQLAGRLTALGIRSNIREPERFEQGGARR